MPTIRTVIKEAEKRVIFFVDPDKPRQGDNLVLLSRQDEEPFAVQAKNKFEKSRGVRLEHWRYDPMCGGIEEVPGTAGWYEPLILTRADGTKEVKVPKMRKPPQIRYIGGWSGEWL